jgi:hypothetical protein
MTSDELEKDAALLTSWVYAIEYHGSIEHEAIDRILEACRNSQKEKAWLAAKVIEVCQRDHVCEHRRSRGDCLGARLLPGERYARGQCNYADSDWLIDTASRGDKR